MYRNAHDPATIGLQLEQMTRALQGDHARPSHDSRVDDCNTCAAALRRVKRQQRRTLDATTKLLHEEAQTGKLQALLATEFADTQARHATFLTAFRSRNLRLDLRFQEKGIFVAPIAAAAAHAAHSGVATNEVSASAALGDSGDTAAALSPSGTLRRRWDAAKRLTDVILDSSAATSDFMEGRGAESSGGAPRVLSVDELDARVDQRLRQAQLETLLADIRAGRHRAHSIMHPPGTSVESLHQSDTDGFDGQDGDSATTAILGEPLPPSHRFFPACPLLSGLGETCEARDGRLFRTAGVRDGDGDGRSGVFPDAQQHSDWGMHSTGTAHSSPSHAVRFLDPKMASLGHDPGAAASLSHAGSLSSLSPVSGWSCSGGGGGGDALPSQGLLWPVLSAVDAAAASTIAAPSTSHGAAMAHTRRKIQFQTAGSGSTPLAASSRNQQHPADDPTLTANAGGAHSGNSIVADPSPSQHVLWSTSPEQRTPSAINPRVCDGSPPPAMSSHILGGPDAAASPLTVVRSTPRFFVGPVRPRHVVSWQAEIPNEEPAANTNQANTVASLQINRPPPLAQAASASGKRSGRFALTPAGSKGPMSRQAHAESPGGTARRALFAAF